MPSVKISELPVLSQLSANNANTVFVVVDKTTNTTSQFSTTVLAQGLYANNILNVGTANTGLLLPNSVAQFISDTEIFSQVNFQNINEKGSGDIVITADDGDNSNNYLDLGVQGSNMDPDPDFDLPNNDGYLYMHGTDNEKQGNLWIGTAVANTDVVFFTGAHKQANEIGRFEDGVGLSLRMPIKFADGTTQNTAAPNVVTINANTIYTQGVDATQNTNITTANNHAWAAFTKANNALANTSGTFAGNLNINGFITLNTAGGIYQETACPSIMTANTTGNFSIVTNKDVNPYNWNFNQVGTFTLPGEGVIRSNDDVITLQSFDSVNGIARGIYIGTNGGVYFNKGSEPVYLSLTDDSALISNNNTAIMTAISNVRIITDGINTAQQFEFGSNGSLTVPGNLNIGGNVLTTGTISLNNSSFASNTAFVKITASDNFVTQAPSNTNYMLHITGKANSVTRVVLDSFGQNTYPLLSGRMARGSAAAPVATGNNDVLMRIVGNGWTGTEFAPSSPAKIDFVASENYTDTTRGSRIEFWNTPTGSNTNQKIASFNADAIEFTGTVRPEKGFIYNPTLLVGNQTAFTINFATTSLIKATLTADLTISLSNYVYGKVVEVWLTNTGGTTRTVTHGCTATNSSTNSTTFDMPGTSSAYLRYFSIDGDNANTFVAIQSA
jgi:hypothetical protein